MSRSTSSNVAAAVDNETRVLFTHLRAADGIALEAGRVDERSGVAPTGRLNVLPALGRSSGWRLRRRSLRSSIRARISAGSPGVSASVLPSTTQSVSENTLCR